MVRKLIVFGAATILAGYILYACSTKSKTLEERNREVLLEYLSNHPYPAYDRTTQPPQAPPDKATALKHWARENLDALLEFNKEEP